MRIKTNLKAGGVSLNHNQTVKALRIKTNIKSGARGACEEWGCGMNHNQTVSSGLKIKSNIKAGKLGANHNQTLAR